MNANNGLVRLNKALASAGVASRRGADALVFEGLVTVNGQVAESPGIKVDPARDRIEVRGRPVGLPEETRPMVLILNKPVRTVTTASDPQGRTTVFDVLRKSEPGKTDLPRLFSVGRLDYFSQGLLLLTNNGDLCHRLMHPSSHLPKTYRVEVRERATEHMLSTMRSGMRLKEGEELAPIKAKIVHAGPGKTVLELVLEQGVNRQIRRMCRDLGLTILKLERIRQGPLELGGLKPGQWRELTRKETEVLEKAVGLAPQAPKGTGE